jgi:hypothetical protein
VCYGVAWPDLEGWGCYKLVSELRFSTLSLDGPYKWKLKQKFQKELLSKWKKLSFRASMSAKRALREHLSCV